MKFKLLQGDKEIVIEFGAGRGYLSSMIADTNQVSRIYLIDSSSPKLKVAEKDAAGIGKSQPVTCEISQTAPGCITG